MRSQSYLYGRVGWGVGQGVGWDVFLWWVGCGNCAGLAYVSAVSGCGVVGSPLEYFVFFA